MYKQTIPTIRPWKLAATRLWAEEKHAGKPLRVNTERHDLFFPTADTLAPSWQPATHSNEEVYEEEYNHAQ